MTSYQRIRQQALREVAEQHNYGGVRNTWSEPLHYCDCGFESHEKFEVLAHVAQMECERMEREFGRMEEAYLDSRSNT